MHNKPVSKNTYHSNEKNLSKPLLMDSSIEYTPFKYMVFCYFPVNICLRPQIYQKEVTLSY